VSRRRAPLVWGDFLVLAKDDRDLWNRVGAILGPGMENASIEEYRLAYGQVTADERAQIQAVIADHRAKSNGRAASSPPKPRGDPLADAPTLADFLAASEPTHDWLVPALIERGDRVIISGDEGKGKSTLLRQLGLGAAAGINPWARDVLHQRHTPWQVLMVDCENSSKQLRREFPKSVRALDEDTLTALAAERWRVVIRTDGLVLDDHKDTLGERAWLQAIVEAFKPDVLLIGPLYKLMGGDPDREMDARNLAWFFDRLRGPDAQLALIIEAHAPHGQKRPLGWSGWKRWPDFGLHLNADGQLTPFRGGRDDDRWWPPLLHRGPDDEWMWLPTDQPAEPATDPEQAADAEVRQVVQRIFTGEPQREFLARDVITRANRPRGTVRKALAHFEDTGWLTVNERRKQRSDGRMTPMLTFYKLDPDGPGGKGRGPSI
jgi:hypothetical protein